MEVIDPVAILKEIEDACRRCAAGLPGKVEAAGTWSGVGFRSGEYRLVAPLGEIVEVLEYPEHTPVPMTRPWVRGLANVRGRLLTVIDLAACLGGAVIEVTEKTRVLVIDSNGMYSGLLVDEVLGMKHFMPDEFVANAPDVAAFLQPWVRTAYRSDGRTWGVISPHELVEAPQFLQAAV